MKARKSLRPEQRTWLEGLAKAAGEYDYVCGQAITAFGKTFTTLTMVESAMEEGHNVVVTLPNQEVLDQTSMACDEMGLEHGIISTGYPLTPERRLQLVTPRACLSKIKKYGPDFIKPTFSLDDECHNAATESYIQLYQHLPYIEYRTGVSGTPTGANGRGLGWSKSNPHGYKALVLSLQAQEMLDLGERIVEPWVYSPPVVSAEKQAKFKYDKFGEPTVTSQEPVLIEKEIQIDIVKAYEEIAPGTQGLVFTATVKQAEYLCEQFNASGHPAAVLHAKMPKADRRNLVNAFRDGILRILLNCEIITEGFNVENVQTVIFARKTQSIRLWLQIIGRALRWAEGKNNCFIIDALGNIFKNGHPLADRYWDLIDGATGATYSSPIKQCLGCHRWMKKTAQVCRCGKEFEGKEFVFKTNPSTGGLAVVGKGALPVETTMERFNREIKHAENYEQVKAAADRAGYSAKYAKQRWDMKAAAKNGEYMHFMRKRGWGKGKKKKAGA